MNMRAILARQLSKQKGPSSSHAPRSRTHILLLLPPTLPLIPRIQWVWFGSETPPDSKTRDRDYRASRYTYPWVQGDRTYHRATELPPCFPPHYTVTSNIFLDGPSSSLDFEILHSLGSSAEKQHMTATKLRPCTLNGANDLVRGLLQIVDCMDRSANVCVEARAEVSEHRGRLKTLKREMAEFEEIHSATIDSLKSESDRHRAEADEQRQAAERNNAETKAAREELEAFKRSESEKSKTFLQSQEFKEILGPKALKVLQIGFQSCKDQFTEVGLLPSDASPNFPSMEKAISSIPDDVLEDPEGTIQGDRGGEEEDPNTE